MVNGVKAGGEEKWRRNRAGGGNNNDDAVRRRVKQRGVISVADEMWKSAENGGAENKAIINGA